MHQAVAEIGRQGLDEVDEVVELEVLDGSDEVLEVELLGERGADLVVKEAEHAAGALGLDHAPGLAALGRRQGLEQAGDLGRMHAVQQLADALELARLERLAHGLQFAARALRLALRSGGRGLGPGLAVLARFAQHGRAQLRAEVAEYTLFQAAADLLPQHEALPGRQMLEQGGGLGRMQALQQLAHALVAAFAERLDDLLAQRERARVGARSLAVRRAVVGSHFVVHDRKDTCGSSASAPIRASASRPRTVRSDTKRYCWRGSTG